MTANCLFGLFVTLEACSPTLGTCSDEPGENRIAPIALEEFEWLRAEIKPKPGESRWREIPWLTNITEARHRAVAEGKPLLIFTAADGSPLGRT
jgi:hypothetical protein